MPPPFSERFFFFLWGIWQLRKTWVCSHQNPLQLRRAMSRGASSLPSPGCETVTAKYPSISVHALDQGTWPLCLPSSQLPILTGLYRLPKHHACWGNGALRASALPQLQELKKKKKNWRETLVPQQPCLKHWPEGPHTTTPWLDAARCLLLAADSKMALGLRGPTTWWPPILAEYELGA